ncbi:MAG: hypothetical protein IT428_31380 [Planctomycetaceae bacterium]|nr:hypothetical protein [Planctomycetaceae bacterium]
MRERRKSLQRAETEFVACWCDEGFLNRGLRDPHCPYHSGGGWEAEEEIARLRGLMRDAGWHESTYKPDGATT